MVEKLCIKDDNMNTSLVVKTFDYNMTNFIFNPQDTYLNAYRLITDRSIDQLDEVLALNEIGDLLFENVFSVFSSTPVMGLITVLVIEALLNDNYLNPRTKVNEITLKNITNIDANKLTVLEKVSENCTSVVIDSTTMSSMNNREVLEGFEKIVRELYMHYVDKWLYFVFVNFNSADSKQYSKIISKYFYDNMFVTRGVA